MTEVDDLIAVDVPLAGALGVVDVEGEWAEVADVVGDAAGEERGGGLVEIGGAAMGREEAVVDGGGHGADPFPGLFPALSRTGRAKQTEAPPGGVVSGIAEEGEEAQAA